MNVVKELMFEFQGKPIRVQFDADDTIWFVANEADAEADAHRHANPDLAHHQHT